MSSSFLKRVAFIGIVLILAWIIFWRRKETPQRPPAPAPVEVPKKIIPMQDVPPVKPSPRPAPVLTPARTATPILPAPQAILPTPAPLPPPPSAAPLEWQGNDTSVKHAGEVVIRSDHQWIQFWAEHHPDEAAPEVDFAQAMVVGVFAGPRPADQFTIRIVDLRTLPGSLTVSYQEKLPPPGTFAVDVTVYPYQLKVIPRTTLPVKFNKLAPIDPNR
jgi:hypothetical protein